MGWGDERRKFVRSMKVGDTVHIDTDSEQWGRVASDGTVLEVGRKDALVNVASIRANMLVPLSDIFPSEGTHVARIADKLRAGEADGAPPSDGGNPGGLTVRELPELREYDAKRSINRHSTREYACSNGARYVLDRTTDASPPFFTLFRLTTGVARAKPLSLTIEVGGERYWGDGWGWARADAAARAAIAAREASPAGPGRQQDLGEADAAARDMGIGRIAAGLRGKEGVMDIGWIVAGLRAGAGETEGAPQEQPDKCGRCGGELEPGGRCVNPKCPLSQRADPAFWPWRQSPPTASRRPARRVAALEWHRDEVLRMICRALRESARHDTANGISGAEMGTGVDGQAQIALTTGAGENMQTWMLDAESILEKDSGSDVE